MKEMSGGEVIFEMLQARGVECVFGYSGGAVLPLIDAFHGKGIEFYTSSHEQCSGHSAAAYAKATGQFGVVVVTSGPGLTNLVTPLQDALTDGVPLVLFSGQVPTSAMGTDAFQECPATEITRPCTKWNYVCLDFQQLPWAVNEAFRIAMSGRPGPVHVDLPKDIVSMRAQVPATTFIRSGMKEIDAPPMMNMGELNKAAEMINKAKRPIFYVGQGASNCPDVLRRVAHKAQVPVTTTVHGMGIFDERDPLSMHMLGMHGAAYANFAIQNADLIVAIGSRFDDRTTGVMDKYAPKAREAHEAGTGGIVHINIDKSAFGKVIMPTVAVWADCEHALVAMESRLETPDESNAERTEWLRQCLKWKTDYAFGYVKAPKGGLKVQQVIEAMNAYLQKHSIPDKKDVIVATGVGNHQMMAAQFIRWSKPRTMITSGSLGVMGAGLPFAIGAQIGKPDSMTILIDGDGSFNMTNMDLQTVKRYNLPIKMCVMNDDRQQMVWIWQRLFFEGRYVSVTNCNPDYVQLAKAYGIEAIRCETEADLPDALERWLTHDGPCFVDFKVVPDICLPMVAPGKALDEMILLQDRDMIFGDGEEELGEMKFEGLAPS
jgi:acetolactate synthase-1/2/3 large subunit